MYLTSLRGFQAIKGKTFVCSPSSSPFLQDWPQALQSVLSSSPFCSKENLKNKDSSFFCPLCWFCRAACYYLQNTNISAPVLQELVPRVNAREL